MKRWNEILCGIVVLATVSSYLMEYVAGRRGTPFSIGGLPGQVAPILISLFCLASLVLLLVIALIKRRPAAKTVSVLTLSFLIFVLSFAVVPMKVFRAGFRQRIKSTVSPDELRALARLCHEKMPLHGRLPGPEKMSLWNEQEHRPLWNVLLGATSLGKLDPSLTIFNNTDTIEIAWGGALAGHWGLIIQPDDKTEPGDVAEGIKTFISSE